jgi:hypothetical protein
MFEEDLLDEEIKKKKRRVLILLFILVGLGTMVALPLAEVSPPPATPVSEAPIGTRAHTPTPAGLTAAPARTATHTPAPGAEATATVPPERTVQPTGTATPVRATFTATEGAVGGAGGGALAASPTATGGPVETVPTPATPTPIEPGQLPAAGADAGRGLGWLTWGLAAALAGMLMLAAACTLRDTQSGQR